MRDYSPLFNQGLYSIVATPAVTTHFRKPAAIIPLVVLPPAPRQENSVQARRSRRIANGRSFLNLKTSVNTDEDSFKVPSLPRTATGVTFQSSRRASSTSSAKPYSPTSPSRRALPLAKPAPLSSLPAIPISTAPTTSTSAPSSPVASSAALAPTTSASSSSSSAARKKHASLAPSFFSTRTHLRSDSVLSGFLMDMTASPSGSSTPAAPAAKEEKESSVRSVSTAYRKRRRQDALQALEGRGSRGTSSRRRDRAPSTSHHGHHHHHHHITSFMPSILHEVEVEEAEDPMKLLLEDAVAGYAASSFRSPTTKHHLYRSHLSFGSAAAPHAFAVKPPSRDSNAIFSAASSVAPKTRRSSNGMLMMSPTTPCFSVSYPGEDSWSALSAPPRRASAGTGSGVSKGCGWGMNFIDLVDDDASSSIWRWSHVA